MLFHNYMSVGIQCGMKLILRYLFEKATTIKPFNLEIIRIINFYILRSELSIAVAKKKMFL